MQYRKILFVCSGNTCRSPMAEAAFRAELKRRKISWYKISSAGVHARDGAPMNADAKTALQEAKIKYPENFASRHLTQKLASEAYAVICMTEDLCDAIPGTNVTSFYQLAGRQIPDPYGQGIGAYRIALRMIRECFPKIIDRLGMAEQTD